MPRFSEKRLDELQGMINNKSVRALLDVISATEGAGYNTLVYGGEFNDYSKHPNKSKTANLKHNDGSVKSTTSTAAGRYQINHPTWSGITPKGKQAEGVLQWSNGRIKDFSPENQDFAALILLDRVGALDPWLKGDYKTALDKAATTWAGLPSDKYGVASYGYGDIAKFLSGREGVDQNALKNLKGVGAKGKPRTLRSRDGKTSKTVKTTANPQPSTTAASGGVVSSGPNHVYSVDDFIQRMRNALSSPQPQTPAPALDTSSPQGVDNLITQPVINQSDFQPIEPMAQQVDYAPSLSQEETNLAGEMLSAVNNIQDLSLRDLNEELRAIRLNAEADDQLSKMFGTGVRGYVPKDVSEYITSLIKSSNV